MKYFGGQLFWLPSDEVVVVPASDSRLLGLRVRDGETAWELPIGSKIVIENGHVVSLQDGTAEVHKIGS